MENQTEIWKDVAGYEGLYQVSNFGNVKSLERFVRHNSGGLKIIKCFILKGTINNYGYRMYTLRKNAINKIISGHFLVAKMFVLNPNNKPQIHHKDSDKLNNFSENLEWTTHKENMSKGVLLNEFPGNKGAMIGRNGAKCYNSKGVILYNEYTQNEFESIGLAANFLGVKPIAVSRVLNNKRTHIHKWKVRLSFG